MANDIARSLRKRLTVAESVLWEELRDLRRQGYHFRKQAPIDGFIVDFACFSHRVVVEVDGAQHFEPEHQLKDSNRDAHLQNIGFSVVRCTNADVMENRDGVVLEILAALGAVVRQDYASEPARSPHPYPSPQGGGGCRSRNVDARSELCENHRSNRMTPPPLDGEG